MYSAKLSELFDLFRQVKPQIRVSILRILLVISVSYCELAHQISLMFYLVV